MGSFRARRQRPLFTGLMPLAFGGVALICWEGIRRGRDWLPFASALGLFALTLVGLGISIRPYVIPGRVTLGIGWLVRWWLQA